MKKLLLLCFLMLSLLPLRAETWTPCDQTQFPEGVLGYTSEPETWVKVGNGQWTDPLWLWDLETPLVKTVDIERSIQHPEVYRTKPFSDSEYVKIYTENPSKVYVTPYSHANTNNDIMIVTQRCQENGVNESYYGTLKDGVITIPGNYFRSNKQGSTSYTAGDSNRKLEIILPDGFNDPIEEDNGIFMGIVSFSDKLNNKPISLLNKYTEPEFTAFVDNMEMANATLLYYGVDQAVSALKKPIYPDNLTNVVLITFTDGLDQGSLAMKPDMLTSRNYADYLSNLIATTKVQNHEIQAYSIGLKGSDVVDDELFMLNLQSLASSADKVHAVDDIKNVENELYKIYEDLSRQTSQRVLSLRVPMMSHGDKYRFTLDGTTDASKVNQSSQWIEGTYDITNNSLKDITYKGITSTSGSVVAAEKDGVYIILTFEDCRDKEGNILDIDKNDIDQWQYIASKDIWQHNLENDKDGNIKIEDIRTSAAVMLVLDCSTSLGDKFTQLKQTANSFINRLAGGAGSGIFNITVDEEQETDWSNAEYYNLQGVRVDNPTTGLYIQRKGNVARKVIIR